MKIVALTTVSCSYLVARYSAFAIQFPDYDLYVIEFGSISTTYQWHPDNSVVPYKRVILSDQPAEQQSTRQLFIGLNKALKQIQPDILVICGYGVPGMLPALAWSKLHCKPTLLLSESKLDDTPRTWWKETIKSWIIQQYQCALVGGQAHRRYLLSLGMKPEAIFIGYDVVSNATFHPEQIKSLPRLVQNPYFLAVNRFVPKKNLSLLIEAYASYRQVASGSIWDLVLCGDGPMKTELVEQITQLGLESFIHLPGFLQPNELLPYFAHANCFIHASIQEQWGLVVNEAMAAGLPIIVSRRCGCFEDLIVEEKNGFGFDPENQQELTNLMSKISMEDFDYKTIGNAALSHIQKFSPRYFAQNLKQAIEYALTQS